MHYTYTKAHRFEVWANCPDGHRRLVCAVENPDRATAQRKATDDAKRRQALDDNEDHVGIVFEVREGNVTSVVK